MALSVLFMFMSVATSLADAMLAVYCFQQKNGGRDLGITCIGCCVTGLTYMLSVLPVGYRLASIFASLYFVSIDVLLWFLIGFAVQYTQLSHMQPVQIIRKLLLLLCACDSFFMLINPFTEIAISYSYRGTTIAPYAYDMKPLYGMHLVICYVMVVIVLALFIYKSVTTPSDYRRQYLISVVGIVLVVGYNALFLFLPDKTVLNFLDYSIWGYSFAAFFIYWNAYSYSQHGMLNHFRSWVFNNISQGLVLFDFEDNRMTHNECAESLLPQESLA